MIDLEKLRRGLRHCITEEDCRGCPYFGDGDTDGKCGCRTDAIKMIDEYENLVQRHKILVKTFDDLLADIKEQQSTSCKECVWWRGGWVVGDSFHSPKCTRDGSLKSYNDHCPSWEKRRE